MSRFAIILGLSAVLGQSLFAASSFESSDEVKRMHAMLKDVEAIFGNEPKPSNEGVKAYESLLRKSLEDAILASAGYSFTSVDLEKIREAVQLEPSPEQQAIQAAKAEFVGETLVKLAKEEV